MRGAWLFLIAVFLTCPARVLTQIAPQVVIDTAVSSSTEWESEIAAFEAADRRTRPRLRSIVFVGSSSIVGWETLQADFPDVPVVNRGFGGSQISDVVRYAERILVPHIPRVVVLYAGDNDLAAGKTPAQVFADFKSFVALIRRELPATKVVFIAIKPSIDRFGIIDKVRETNHLIQNYARTRDKIVYVDVFTPMLDASGNPRRELFLEDGLHMNARGYAIWRDLIAPVVR
jgi:lysophospholipase L1-like esterase